MQASYATMQCNGKLYNVLDIFSYFCDFDFDLIIFSSCGKHRLIVPVFLSLYFLLCKYILSQLTLPPFTHSILVKFILPSNFNFIIRNKKLHQNPETHPKKVLVILYITTLKPVCNTLLREIQP